MTNLMRFASSWHHHLFLFHVSNIPSHSLVFSTDSPQDLVFELLPSRLLFFLSCYCAGAVLHCAWKKMCDPLISCLWAFQHMRAAEGWDSFRMQSWKVSQVGRRGLAGGCWVTQLCDELSWTWPGRLEMFVRLFPWDYGCGRTPRHRNMEDKQLPPVFFL